ncbi:MAG TPA: YceI family protein [Candidatus Polarisedimenticolia bacterium]|nr:YceI family protein [Candidatus Polarisedimenticolia bacterium]
MRWNGAGATPVAGRRARALGVAALALGLASVSSAPSSGLAAASPPPPTDLATASPAPPAAPAAAPTAGVAPPGPINLVIDKARSTLTFVITRPGESIEGRVHQLAGEVTLDPAHPGEGASVELRVQAESLETGNRIRDRKMRHTHLESETFPEIRFRSTSVRLGPADGDRAAPPLEPGETRRALVEGTLGLHGVERSMLIPATIRYDGGSLAAEGEAVVGLTDHGIPIPRFLWIVLDDAVKVHFHIIAVPPAAGGAGAG